MKRYFLLSCLVVLTLALLSACSSNAETDEDVAIANPASEFCIANGGELILGEGDSVGMCHFSDGSVCEEWAFYRGECAPGATACQQFRADLTTLLGVEVSAVAPLSITDAINGRTADGCQLTAVGTGADFAHIEEGQVATAVIDLVTAQGWTADLNYSAGGPMGTSEGLFKDGDLCMVNVAWVPAEGVDCPADQPISMCELTPEQKLYTVEISCLEE